MLFNVPQFIDKEDKLVGPLTAKQLGWMACAAVTMLVLWAIFDMAIVILAGVPVLALFGALAFYRPNNQPFVSFVLSSFSFASKPKMYVWKRLPDQHIVHKAPKKEIPKTVPKKIVTGEKIEEIAKLLDAKNQ